MPTTCSVTNLVLDAGLPHVTLSVNAGVWHQYPPCTLEETEASGSHMTLFSGPSLGWRIHPPPGVEGCLLPFWLSSSQKTPRLLKFAPLQLPCWERWHRLWGQRLLSPATSLFSQRLPCGGGPWPQVYTGLQETWLRHHLWAFLGLEQEWDLEVFLAHLFIFTMLTLF